MSAFKNLTTDDITVATNIVVNGTSGNTGYVIQRTTDNSTQEWTPKNVYLSVARQDNYDINTGDEYMRNGAVQYQQGTSFEFNGSGSFTCLRSDTYLFVINGRFDTFNGQSKFRITDGTNKYGVNPLMYIPGVTEIQTWQVVILLPAEVGQVWGFIWESYGVGGVVNTIFSDPDYGNTTCNITILG